MIKSIGIFTLFAFIIAGCGGGGGEQGDSGSSNGVSINTSSVNFSAYQNANSPDSQTFTISWTNSQINQIVAGYPADETPVNWLGIRTGFTATTSRTLTLSINTTNLSAGDHSTTVRIVSGDSTGNIINIIDIPVTFSVLPGVSISPTSFQFNTYEGLTPAPQNVLLDYQGTEIIPWTTRMIYTSSGGNNWINITPTNGPRTPVSITVTPNIATLSARQRFALLRVDYELAGMTISQQLPIDYIVLPAWADSVPTAVDFTIDETTTLSDLTQTVTVNDLYPGTDTISWSASTNVNWINIITTSGDTDSNNSVTFSIQESELGSSESLKPGNIILTPDNPDITTKVIPVTITYNAPTVSHVTPNVQFVGQPKNVIVRGTGFLNINAANVIIGGVPTQVDIISDTEMHVTPAASLFDVAGSYPISVSTSALNYSQGVLHVVNLPAYGAAEIPTTNYADNIIHDPLRNSLYYIDRSEPDILIKQSYNQASGWQSTNLTITNLLTISDTANKSELLATSSFPNVVHHIDPDTMTINKSVLISADPYTDYRYIQQLNDGLTILSDPSRSSSDITYPERSSIQIGIVNGSVQILSENRDVLINGPSGTTSASQLIYVFDASDRSLTSIDQFNFRQNQISLSHWAERIVIAGRVYDASLSYLGDLPYVADLNFPNSLVVSPEGNQLYTLRGNQLTIYDISGTSAPFPEVGSPVTIAVGESGDSIFARQLRISQDGSTLFASYFVSPQFNFPDYYRIAVIPVP